MAKDQSDVLKELIKQAKDPKVVEQAKAALAEMSQRKAEITAQISESLGASEKLKEGASLVKDEKVAINIKDLLKESKDHTTSLKSLVKLNQKSIEDNSELFGRLEKTMSSLLDSIQEQGRDRSTNQQPNTAGFSRSVNASASGGTNNPSGSGGFNIPDLGGFRRTIGGGANAAPTAAQPGKFSRFMRGAARIGAGAIGGGLLGGAAYGMMSPDQQAALNEMTGGNGDLALTGAGTVLGGAAATPGIFGAIGQGISKGAGYLARGATSVAKGAPQLLRGPGSLLANPLVAGGTALTAGGAALSYGATKFTEGEGGKKIYEMIQDNPLAGAMAGDYALASSIQHGPKKTEEEISKERDQLKDAPWYTRLYGIGKDKYLNRDAEASDIGNLGSNQAPINPNILQPGVTPDISGGFQITGREEFDPALVNKEAQTPGVTPDITGIVMPAKQAKSQDLYQKSLEEWRQLGGEDSDTEGFMNYYNNKKQEVSSVSSKENEKSLFGTTMLGGSLSEKNMQESNTNTAVTGMGDTGGFGDVIGRVTKQEPPTTETNTFNVGAITSKQLEGENQDYTKDIVPDDTQTDAVISKLAEMFNAKTAEKAASDEGSKAPIIVNNQGGDTINNVTNNTSGGSSGGAGSPSRMPGPWDAMTLGKSWEAYP